MMIPLAEYARRNGRLPDSARQMALRGGFKTAEKVGNAWLIDENEPYPDARVKSGKKRMGVEKMEMSNELYRHIAEIYGTCDDPITGIIWEEDAPWQLWKFERDVEFQEKIWRCVIIEKVVYDPDDPTAVDFTDVVFSNAFILR